MANKALQSEELGEDEMQPAPKLLEVILQNCRGRVDEWLPLYLQARPHAQHALCLLCKHMLCVWIRYQGLGAPQAKVNLLWLTITTTWPLLMQDVPPMLHSACIPACLHGL